MSDRLTLLTSQKNTVFELVQWAELDPFSFAWKDVKSARVADLIVSRLVYDGGPYFFQFDFHHGGHYALFAPAEDRLSEARYPGDWPPMCRAVEDWLRYLRRELGAVDRWATLEQHRLPDSDRLLEAAGADGNDPFTALEAEEVRQALREAKDYLLSQAHEEDHPTITDRFSYLETAVTRQGRRDWLHTTIGVLVTLAVTLDLSTETISGAWSMIRAVLWGVLQLPP